jgi:hypothetical protein
MPITPPTTVVASHLRWPLRVYGRTVYRLVTDDGDFVAAKHPDIFDPTGQPTALSAELATGSIVRVSMNNAGAMTAVQLIAAKFDNPFARWLAPRIPPQREAQSPDGQDFRLPRIFRPRDGLVQGFKLRWQ